MPPELTKNQIDDIRDIRDLCAEFNADFVIIGAIAYKLYFPDEDRFTADIDAVIALDSDEFVEFARRLEEFGWKRDPNLEHRWRISTLYRPVPNWDGRSKSFGLKASS